MNPQPLIKTPRDAKYLKFIRTLPCTICGTTLEVDGHHTDTGGIALVGSDYSALPLCRVHHSELHQKSGKKGTWRSDELESILARLFAAYENSKNKH